MKHIAEFFHYDKERLQGIRWWRLRPNQDLLIDQPGKSDPTEFVSVASSPNNRLVVAYLPRGGSVSIRDAYPIDIKKSGLSANYRQDWFDPRTGQYREAPPSKDGRPAVFTAPTTEDWILILGDDSERLDEIN